MAGPKTITFSCIHYTGKRYCSEDNIKPLQTNNFKCIMDFDRLNLVRLYGFRLLSVSGNDKNSPLKNCVVLKIDHKISRRLISLISLFQCDTIVYPSKQHVRSEFQTFKITTVENNFKLKNNNAQKYSENVDSDFFRFRRQPFPNL